MKFWILSKFTSALEDQKLDNKIKMPFVIMLTAVVLIYLPLLTGDIWPKWDMYDNYFPLEVSISDSIKQGSLPLWDPFIRRGTPIAYLVGMPVWHPLTMFFGMFGFSLYLIQIQYICIILLASIFVYLAVRNYVNNRWICSAAGVAYSTCGLFISNSSHLTYIIAAMSFPILHYAMNRWIRLGSLKNSILVGVAISSLVLNNYPSFLVMALVFVLIEFFFHFKEYNARFDSIQSMIKNLLTFLGCVSLTVLMLSMVALFTNVGAVENITRHSLPWSIATEHSLSIWHWIGALSPFWMKIGAPFNTADVTMQNTYMAIPFLICLLCALPRKRSQWGFLVIALLAFFLTLGRNGFLYYLVYKYIPTMDAFRFPAGLRFYFFYYAILLGAIHYESIKNKILRKEKLFTVAKFIVLINFIVLICFVCAQYLAEDKTEGLFPQNTFWELGLTIGLISLLIVLLKRENSAHYSIVFFVIVVVFSYINFARNDLYVIGSESKPPGFENELSTIYSQEKYEVKNSFTHPLPDTVQRVALGTFYKKFYTDGYIGGFELTRYEEAKENKYIPNEGDPVIWTPKSVAKVQGNEVTVDRQEKDELTTPSTIYVGANEFQTKLNVPQERFVVIEQNYFKGWRAYIDGMKSDIFEATGGVMAVRVSAGEHELKMVFDPDITRITAYLTFISWFGFIVFGLVLLVQKNFGMKGTKNKWKELRN